MEKKINENAEPRTAVFGGGCFWCTESVFKMLKGVVRVEPGYAGGESRNPTYERVSQGDSGHAEVIRVTYDPAVISYEDLLTVFFGSHDPTTPNRQGNDVGPQYRSLILYRSDEEREIAQRTIKDIQATLKGERVVTEVVRLRDFYPAEEYHHDYYAKNTSAPYCQLIIEPKLEKVRKRFTELLAAHG